jgi:hypothetical protein
VAANVLEKQIVEEGPRNAVVKLTGTLSSGDLVSTPAIALSDFVNNSWINGRLAGLRVDAVMYSMGLNVDALLEWNSAIPQQIMPLAGRGKIDITGDGGLLPDMLRSGYDGSINLRTTGFVPGTVQNFTFVLRMAKLFKQ